MTAEIELARPRGISLNDKLQYAKALAVADLLPDHFKRQPGNVLWAVEYAEALRLPTIAAITGVHVIEGRPAPSAALMSALVRRAGHKVRIAYTPGADGRDGWQGTGWCEIVRADDPDFTFRAEWTIPRAITALLCTLKDGQPYSRSKNGKPQSWEKYPQNMLKWRALAECARDACEEALMGMHYLAEELGAEVDSDGAPLVVTAEATRVDQRPADPDWASKPATAHERATGHPEHAGWSDEEWTAAVDAAAAQGDVEARQGLWRKAKAERPNDLELREHIASAAKTVKDALLAVESSEPIDADVVEDAPAEQRQHRDERLAVTSHLIGKDITSSSQLKYGQAELVIERLQSFDAVGKDALFAQIDRWLGEYHASRPAAADEPAEEAP
jgi:hypothetical protein